MTYRIGFGIDQSVEFPALPSIWRPEFAGAQSECVQDIVSATRAAIEAPLGLPSLAECITQDDTVVLAVRPGTPRSSEIAGTIAESVLSRLAPSHTITILRTQRDALAGRADPRRLLKPEIARRVIVKTHRAEDPQELAYLARFDDGQVLRLNRSLVEADVVIPIGWTQCGGTWNRYSAFGAVFPVFADSSAQQRHWREVVERLRARKTPSQKRGKSSYRPAVAISREADWLMGTQFAFQVVPGPGENVLGVLAGEITAVFKAAEREFRRQWGMEIRQQSELVIAGVDHNPLHNAWENLAQAAWSAARLVAPRGQIILLTDWGPAEGAGTNLGFTPSDAARRGSWTDLLQEFGDRIVPFWILSRVRRRAGVCVWSPRPAGDPAWESWVQWLGVETSSRVEVLHRWVRNAASATLLSHATLAWPFRPGHSGGRPGGEAGSPGG